MIPWIRIEPDRKASDERRRRGSAFGRRGQTRTQAKAIQFPRVRVEVQVRREGGGVIGAGLAAFAGETAGPGSGGFSHGQGRGVHESYPSGSQHVRLLARS